MSEDLIDLVVDIGEAVLDQSFDDGVFRDIPVLGSLVGIAKVAHSVPERILAAKVRRFLKVLSEVSPDDRARFSSMLDGDPDRRRMLGEIVLLSIERSDRLEKAELLAITLLAYIRDEITAVEYRKMCAGILQADLDILHEFLAIIDADPSHNPKHLKWEFEQLVASSFVRASGMMSPKGDGTLTLPTELGLKFYTLWKCWV